MKRSGGPIFLLLFMSAVSALGQIPVLSPGVATRLEDLKGKVVMTRTFSGGPLLRYDSAGTILEGGSPESWMLAAIRLDEIHRHNDVLEIRGTRMGLLWDGMYLLPVERQVQHGRGKPKPDNVIIIVNLRTPDDAAAIASVERIFVTSLKQLREIVPEYWQDHISNLIRQSQKTTTMSGEKVAPATTAMADQGKHESPDSGGSDTGNQPQKIRSPVPQVLPEEVFRVGGGVSPPRAIFNPDAVYVEAARIAKIQGTVVLWVTVGSNGSVRDVRIARTIGFGLDDSAVAAVKQWQFKPAMKDGQPVAVQINVQVNFRLQN